jgi:hypothetical protein
MKTATATFHPLLWFLFGALLIALVAMLSRSAADLPPPASADNAVTTQAAP